MNAYFYVLALVCYATGSALIAIAILEHLDGADSARIALLGLAAFGLFAVCLNLAAL
jgi:hypothetical protein